MDIRYPEHATKALFKMSRVQQAEFIGHVEKMMELPPRKHLRFGQQYNVEKVGQGRIVYRIEGNVLFVTRCFATHKDYEKWYKSLNNYVSIILFFSARLPVVSGRGRDVQPDQIFATIDLALKIISFAVDDLPQPVLRAHSGRVSRASFASEMSA